MNISFFVSLFVLEAAVAGLCTQAVKKWYENAHKDYSSNTIALVNAVIVGGIFTSASYLLVGIEFTINNIIAIVGMCALNWFGSMLGYDKIIQWLKQIEEINKSNEIEKK